MFAIIIKPALKLMSEPYIISLRCHLDNKQLILVLNESFIRFYFKYTDYEK